MEGAAAVGVGGEGDGIAPAAGFAFKAARSDLPLMGRRGSGGEAGGDGVDGVGDSVAASRSLNHSCWLTLGVVSSGGEPSCGLSGSGLSPIRARSRWEKRRFESDLERVEVARSSGEES